MHFPNVLLPLLATTGSASIPQGRRLFLEFLKIKSCFSLVRIFFTVFVESVSPLCVFLMFCFHYWRRRDPPVPLSCGDSFSSFLKKCIVFVSVYLFFTVFVDSVSPLCIFLMCCFHYWRRRDQPVHLRSGEKASRILTKTMFNYTF